MYLFLSLGFSSFFVVHALAPLRDSWGFHSTQARRIRARVWVSSFYRTRSNKGRVSIARGRARVEFLSHEVEQGSSFYRTRSSKGRVSIARGRARVEFLSHEVEQGSSFYRTRSSKGRVSIARIHQVWAHQSIRFDWSSELSRSEQETPYYSTFYFLSHSDEGPMLETLDYAIRIGSIVVYRPFYISICISTLPILSVLAIHRPFLPTQHMAP